MCWEIKRGSGLSQLVDEYNLKFNVNGRPLDLASTTEYVNHMLSFYSDKNTGVFRSEHISENTSHNDTTEACAGGVSQFIADFRRRCFCIGSNSKIPLVFKGGVESEEELNSFVNKLREIKIDNSSKPNTSNTLHSLLDNLYASGLVDGSFLNFIVKTFFLNQQIGSESPVNGGFERDLSNSTSRISYDNNGEKSFISFKVRNTKEQVNFESIDNRLNLKFNFYDDDLNKEVCVAESKIDVICECILSSDGVSVNLTMPDQISNALFYSDNLLKLFLALFSEHKNEEVIFLLEQLVSQKSSQELESFLNDERLSVYELMCLYDKCFPVTERLDKFVSLLESRLQDIATEVGAEDICKLGNHINANINKVDNDISFHLKALYKDCYRGNFGADKNVSLRTVMSMARSRYDNFPSIRQKCTRTYFMCMALFVVALPLVFNKVFFKSKPEFSNVFYKDSLSEKVDFEEHNLLGMAIA